MLKKIGIILLAAVLTLTAGCSLLDTVDSALQSATQTLQGAQTETQTGASAASDTVVTEVSGSASGALDATEQFTERDLTQTAELSEAVACSLRSGQDVSITEAGVYVLTGSAENVTVTVDAADDDKVQLVLDGVTVTNDDAPVIYIKNADKTFVTTTESDNCLTVTGAFSADGETNTDAAIYAKDDLTLNGLGTLTICSTENGISCKNDLKITGGTITVDCKSDALEAGDSIRIAGGTIRLTSSKDGLHAENSDDDTTGYVYICGGTLTVSAEDDGIHATSIAQIDGGTVELTAHEGLEATWVQLNDGSVTISATDDGINGTRKSSAYATLIEINGGYLKVSMASGDTDAVDSNGDLVITGGTIEIVGQNSFDYDGACTWTGGTIYINGEQITEITNQFFGGMGGMGGGPGGGRP